MFLQNYKAIIFDWDGTLVDTCGLVLDAHNHVRAHYDLPLWTMEDFLGRASESAREYYPRVYGDKADEAQKLLYVYVEGHHLDNLAPMKNVVELFELINQSNIPMGIVSNKRHKTLNIEMDYMKWRDHFDVVLGAGEAKTDKPSAAPLLMALDMMSGDLTPADILYVGDTETDLLTAKNAGCDVVFVQSDAPRPDLIEQYNPIYSCFDLAGLMGKLRSMTAVA